MSRLVDFVFAVMFGLTVGGLGIHINTKPGFILFLAYIGHGICAYFMGLNDGEEK